MNPTQQNSKTGGGFDPTQELDAATGSVTRYGTILHFLARAARVYIPQIVAAKRPLGGPLDRLIMLASNHVQCESATLNVRGSALTVSYNLDADELTVSAPERSNLPSGKETETEKLPAFRPSSEQASPPNPAAATAA